MKALSTLTLALSVAATGCGSNSPTPPTSNSSGQNMTTTTTYAIDLKSSNEKPNPVTNSEAPATGTANITLRVTRDPSNAFVSASADFNVTMQGFPAGSIITQSHIHSGDASNSGGIVVNTGLAAGEAPLTNGAGSFQKNNVNVTADIAQGILSSPAAYYFNVHSQLNSGGVLRAQMNNTGAPADPGQPKPGDPNDPYYPTPGRAR
jgi:hypothetical protein